MVLMGRGGLSEERPSFPPPSLPLSSPKTFVFIESTLQGIAKKEKPSLFLGRLFAIRESRYEGFDKVKSLGKGGVWGRETFLQKGFPPPHFFFPYCFTGTVEIALKGEPSTRRRLTAR